MCGWLVGLALRLVCAFVCAFVSALCVRCVVCSRVSCPGRVEILEKELMTIVGYKYNIKLLYAKTVVRVAVEVRQAM